MAKKKLSNDQESLWASVMANPGDDAPRLVYADWLEENGGESERAQLIRVQCRLARGEATEAMAKEEAKLLKGRQKRWLEESTLPKFKSVTWGPFRRGFVDSVICRTVYHFRKFGTRIAEVIPLDGVHIKPVKDGYPRQLLGFGKMKPLATVGELSLVYQNMTVKELEPLLESPYLTRLRRLDLSDNPLGMAGVRALLKCTTLPALRHVCLQECNITRDVAVAILESTWVQSLQSLDLDRNRLGPGTLRELQQAFGERVRLPRA